jgi:hypothetical protein
MSTITITPSLVVALVAAAIVELVLKGMATWRAAHHNDIVWFVLLLVLDTVGILPLIYLLFFSKTKKKAAK